jgi:hypothetical protein
VGTTGLTVRITHPFHPLNGQPFEMISHSPPAINGYSYTSRNG